MTLAGLQFSSPHIRRMALAIDGICEFVGRAAQANALLAPLLVLAWSRLCRNVGRLDRLFARWKSGTLEPPRVRTPQARASRPQPLRLPTSECWLLRLAQPAAQFRPHLEAVLAEPDIIEFLRQVPRAARLLNPLRCAMGLVNVPAELRPKPRTRRPRPTAEPPPAPRRARVSSRPYSPGRIRPPARKPP